MGAGKGSSTATTQSAPPAAVMGDYYNLLDRAQSVASTPYQAYAGQQLAPFSQSQQTAFNTVDQAQGAAQPDINQAQNYAAMGAAPISGSEIAGYENPYQNQVINATLGQIGYLDAQQQAQLTGQGLGSGGLFNDRSGVASANLAYNQDLANNQTISQLNTQNYAQALAAAQAQQGAYAGASYQFGNLGNENLNTILTGANAQLGTGAIQQQQAQSALNIPYQTWQQQQAFPYQQTGWLAGLETGVGSNLGGQSQTVSTPPAPNPWNVGLGLGLAGLGAYTSGPQGAAAGWGIGSQVKRGGRVDFDAGGSAGGAPNGAPAMPYSGGSSWVPSYPVTHGGGPPRPPMPQQARQSGITPKNIGDMFGGFRSAQPGGAPTMLTPQAPSTIGDLAPIGQSASGGLGPLYRAGGPVEHKPGGIYMPRGYDDGGTVTPDQPDLGSLAHVDAIDPAALSGIADRGDSMVVPKAIMHAVAPGLMRYLTTPAPPPQITPNASGKVPPADYNPNTGPALQDVTNLGMAALPLGRAASLAGEAAPIAARAGALARTGGAGAGLRAIGSAAGMMPSPAEGAPQPAASAPPPSAVTEALGPRPSMSDEDKASVDRLNQEIAALAAKRASAIKGIGPKGAAVQGASYDTQINQRNSQLADITKQLANRQSEYDDSASKFSAAYAQSTAPFAIREPEWATAGRAMPAASTLGGSLLGALAGSKVSPLKRMATYGAAGVGGALEGGLGAYMPTFMDLGMPEGSVAKTQARKSNADPSYWENDVLPEAGFSAGLGMLGAKYGMLRPGSKAALPLAAAETQTGAPAGKAASAGPIKAFQDPAGRWREQGSGRFVPKSAIPGKPRLVSGGSAAGGRIGYDDGGAPVDFNSRFSPYSDAPVADSAAPTSWAPVAPNPASGAPWRGLADVPLPSSGGSTLASLGSVGADRAPVSNTVGSASAVAPAVKAPASGGIDWGRYTNNTFGIESGWNPQAVTGRNRGLGQFGPEEERQYGINDANRTDPQVQARALRMEADRNIPRLTAVLGRAPTEGELYLAHQQGGGGPSLLANPDVPAWQAIRQHYPSDRMAKQAISENIPPGSPLASVPVESIRAGDFTNLWTSRYARGPGGEYGGGETAFSSDQHGGVPQGVAGAQGSGTGTPVGPQSGGFGSSRFGNALMTAGLSLAASRSPYLGEAVGQAGLAGLGNYQEQGRYEAQQQQQEKRLNLQQSQVDARVKQLDQMAENSKQHLDLQTQMFGETQARDAETARKNAANEKLAREKADPEYIGAAAAARVPAGTMNESAKDGAAEQYLKTGTFPPQMSRNVADKNDIINRAYQKAQDRNLDPQELPKQWQIFRTQQVGINRFMSGPLGNTVRSLNVATDHLDTLRQLGKALDNGNIPLFNELGQRWSQATGNPQPGNFDTAKQIIGSEVIKAIGVAGAGTKEEREGLASQFSRASSPAQLEGVINDSIRPLLLGQLRGLRMQFGQATGLGEDAFGQSLTPATRAFLNDHAGVASPATSGATPPRGAPAGTRQAPDGRFYAPDPARPGKYLMVQ